MSVLPMDFSFTLQAFDCPEDIEAYEVRGQLQNGHWVEVEENRRTVSDCILLGVDEEILELIAEGNIVDEAYCVMFDRDLDTFHIADQQDANIQPLQTHLVIDGKDFLVKRNPKTAKNANFKSYYAIRYKAITDVPANP